MIENNSSILPIKSDSYFKVPFLNHSSALFNDLEIITTAQSALSTLQASLPIFKRIIDPSCPIRRYLHMAMKKDTSIDSNFIKEYELNVALAHAHYKLKYAELLLADDEDEGDNNEESLKIGGKRKFY